MTAAKVALAQINAAVGDFAGNSRLIEAYARKAAQSGANVLLTPELALAGYPPEDLLLRPSFQELQERTLDELAAKIADLKGLAVVVGHVHVNDGKIYNAASVLLEGKIVGTYCKHALPNYGVFDEQRYFAQGTEPFVFEHAGIGFGINICEDVWIKGPGLQARDAGAQCMLVLNASPFHMGKFTTRIDMVRRYVERTGTGVVYVNLCGAQDELIFDGLSFVMDRLGHCAGHMPAFEEGMAVVEVGAGAAMTCTEGPWEPLLSEEDFNARHLSMVWQALVTGVRDYVHKNGFKDVLIGLSGGVDSALVLAIAVDALGPEHVMTVMMPSVYTADISMIDAQDMAKRLGVRYEVIPIGEVTNQFEAALSGIFKGREPDTTEENIQARVRGTLLMAISNKFGSLVLTTGNKSELATGYCTLYGDMAGAYAVIKDVPKTLVYRLAHWRNREQEIIPLRILTRAPSAELRSNQTDQDSLPPYEVVDAIIEAYVERNLPVSHLIGMGLDPQAVEQVVRLIRINEYKRRQAAPGPKVTVRAFGRDWRYPLSNAFREPPGALTRPGSAV